MTERQDCMPERKLETYPVLVKILHHLRDRLQHGARLLFGEELLTEDLIQQFPSFHQLRHQKDVLAVIKDVLEIQALR